LDKNEARSFQVTVVPLSDRPLSPKLPRTVECMNVNIVPTCCHKGSFQLTIGSEHQSASIAVTPMTLGVNFITGMTEFHGSSKWSFTHSEINDQTDMLIKNPDLFWKNNNEKPKRKIRKYNSADEDAEEEARIESAKKKFHIDIDSD
jgi:hypothetical protein